MRPSWSSCFPFTVYLTCQYWALPIRQQIKVWCHKYWQSGIQFSEWVENIVGKEDIARYKQFLAPLAIGQRAYVMVCCPPSVHVLTFSLNIFFSETAYRILMKFHRDVPAIVLFRIFWKNLIPLKTPAAIATKLKKRWNLKIFLSEAIGPRATKFGM